ncbi:MAG TPA: GAF domain-containing protein, partial [Candidatus Deferrimicrobiaceae bacterium]
MEKKNTSNPSGMNLLGRVSLSLGAALLLFGLLLGHMISGYYERIELKQEKDHLSRYVREEVKHHNLSKNDFVVPKTGTGYESFREKLQEIRDLGDTLMVVVFSPDGTVVWSDFREMVGKRYSSQKLREALRGEIGAELTTPEREGYSFPDAPEEILELYVPIPGETDGSVIGVVEIYQSADGLRASVRTEIHLLWMALGGGFSILFLVLFGIVRQGHRLILSHQEELRASREKIRSQNLELLRQVGASVRGEQEIDKVLAEVTKEVRRLIDLPRCSIRIFGDPDMVVEDRSPGIPSSPSALPGSPRSDDSKKILREGRTWIEEGGRELPGARDGGEAGDRIGLGACLGVPLNTPEGIMGALFLERAGPHRWTPEEVETAEAIAGQVAMAVRQARMFREQQ